MGVFDATLQKYGQGTKPQGGVFSNTLNKYQDKEHQEMVLNMAPPHFPGANSQSTSPFAVGPDTMDLVKEVVQSTTRTVGTVGISAGNLPYQAVGKEGPFPDVIETTGSPITKAIFGDTPIKSFKKYGEAGIEFVDDVTGLEIDKRFAPFFAVAGIAMDLSGAGGAPKGLFKSLHAARSFDEAASVMRKAGFDNDLIEEYAPLFAKTVAKEETSATLEAVLKLQETTKKLQTTPLRVVDNSEPITKGGKVFTRAVQDARDGALKLFDDVATEARTPELVAARSSILRNEAPSLIDLKAVIRQLDEAGMKTDELQASVDDLQSTVKTDPKKFGVVPLKANVPSLAEDLYVPGLKEERPFDPNYQKTGSVPVSKYDAPPQSSHVIPVISQSLKEVENVPIHRDLNVSGADEVTEFSPVRDNPEYQKSGDVPFVGSRDNKVHSIPIKEVPYSGKVPVTGLNETRKIPIGESLYHRSGKVDVPLQEADDILDEVADPVKEDMGRVLVDVQKRYGQEKITKSQAEKFKKNEQGVYMQIFRYVEEFKHISEHGGEMVQTIPAWVPANLRDVQLMEELTEIVGKGEIPTVHGSPHMELYTAMVDEVARKSGIKNLGPKPSVDPAGAVLQSHRERTAAVGAPIAKEEKVGMKKPEMSNRFYPSNTERAFVDTLDLFKAKDKGGFWGKTGSVYQFAEDVFGEQWPKVKKAVFDKFDDAKGRMIADKTKLEAELETDILKGLGIQRKSKESAAVMDLGEGLRTYDQIVKDIGKEKADNVVKAEAWFRKKYDTLLDEINATRPDNLKITKRNEYFRHFNELSGNGTLKNAFEDPGLTNLDDSFLGVIRKSFTKSREGESTTRDAVGGYIDYVSQYVYEKQIAPEIGRINAFIDDLESAKGADKIPGFITRMKMFSEELNGIPNPLDKTFGEFGGQRIVNGINYLNNQAKRNAVLGNVGSMLIQYANIPQAVAVAKQHTYTGAKRFMTDILSGGEPMWKKGNFIPERYSGHLFDAFKVGAIEKTLKNTGKMIGILDEFATKLTWNMMYEKGLAEGVPDAVRYADDLTRKSVGGRGVGEASILQKSKMFQVIGPFSLEQFNLLYRLRDMVKEKDVVGMVLYAATAHFVVNNMFKWATGRDAVFDPISAIQDSYDIYQDKKEDPAKRIAGRLTGEGLQAIPLGNYVVSGVGLTMGMTEEERQNLFGKEGDPAKYGSSPLLWNAIKPIGTTVNFWGEELPSDGDRAKGVLDTALNIALPAGGKQIKNTIQGTGHLMEEDPDPMIQPGVPGAVRNILFGKWAPNIKYEEDLLEEMRVLYLDNQELIAAGHKDEAKENLKAVLTEKTAHIYDTARKEERVKEAKRLIDETRPLVRTIDALVKAGKKDEAKEILKGLDEREMGFFDAVRAEQSNEGYERKNEVEKDPESFVREAIDFAYAFGTNPVQAWNLLSSGDHIETTVGGGFDGMVTARRLDDDTFGDEKGSEDIKAELMKEGGIKSSQMSKYKLEHKLPLALGGSNQRENLELVTNAVHDSSTAMETYLSQAVKRQKIDYVLAQELILRFKGYEGAPITEEEIKKIVGVDKFPAFNDPNREEGVHRGFDDIGRNTLWLSDEDYAKREDEHGYAQGKRGIMHVFNDAKDKIINE